MLSRRPAAGFWNRFRNGVRDQAGAGKARGATRLLRSCAAHVLAFSSVAATVRYDSGYRSGAARLAPPKTAVATVCHGIGHAAQAQPETMFKTPSLGLENHRCPNFD